MEHGAHARSNACVRCVCMCMSLRAEVCMGASLPAGECSNPVHSNACTPCGVEIMKKKSLERVKVPTLPAFATLRCSLPRQTFLGFSLAAKQPAFPRLASCV